MNVRTGVLALAALALLIASAGITASSFAHEDTDGTPPVGATPEQLRECDHYGIPSTECTERKLAEKRLQDKTYEPDMQKDPLQLQAVSSGGSYVVSVQWWPNDILKKNAFKVLVSGPGGQELNGAPYLLTVFGGGDARRVSDTRAGDADSYQYVFDRSGSYVIRLDNIDGSGEHVEVPIQVTPEFHASLLIVAGVVVGTAAVLGRYGGTLFQPSNLWPQFWCLSQDLFHRIQRAGTIKDILGGANVSVGQYFGTSRSPCCVGDCTCNWPGSWWGDCKGTEV